MRKLVFGLAMISLSACSLGKSSPDVPSKESSASSVEGTVNGTIVDRRGLDGCTFMIRLDDGTMLEANIPSKLQVNGQRVRISYVPEVRISICMAGQTVNLSSIEAIN